MYKCVLSRINYNYLDEFFGVNNNDRWKEQGQEHVRIRLWIASNKILNECSCNWREIGEPEFTGVLKLVCGDEERLEFISVSGGIVSSRSICRDSEWFQNAMLLLVFEQWLVEQRFCGEVLNLESCSVCYRRTGRESIANRLGWYNVQYKTVWKWKREQNLKTCIFLFNFKWKFYHLWVKWNRL